MKNPKNKIKKSSDADKALAKAGEISPGKGRKKLSTEISPDPMTAEKDEVKNAEERLRQRSIEKKEKNTD